MSKGLKIALIVFGTIVVVGGLLATGFVAGRATSWFGVRSEALNLRSNLDIQPGRLMEPERMKRQFFSPRGDFGPGAMERWDRAGRMGPGMMGDFPGGRFDCPYHDENQANRGEMRSRAPYGWNRAGGENMPYPCRPSEQLENPSNLPDGS